VRGNGSAGTAPPAVTALASVTDEDTVTLVRVGGLLLTVARVVGTPLDGELTLTGQVVDSGETSVLASLRHS
jgi:hypothetical protein